MVDAERQVGGCRLADRLAVVERLDQGEKVEILLHAIGDPEQDVGALRGRGPAPGVLGGVSRVERQFYVSRGRARDRAQPLAGDRARIVEIAPLDRGDLLAADEIVITVADEPARRNLVNRCLIHGDSSIERVACRTAKSADPSGVGALSRKTDRSGNGTLGGVMDLQFVLSEAVQRDR